MERITIFIRTTKKEGSVHLRFRLRDGESVQLYHSTDIKADLKDLAKFTLEGEVKPRVSVYNVALKEDIKREMDAMHQAYANLRADNNASHITTQMFELEIESMLNKRPVKFEAPKETFIDRFKRYVEEAYSSKYFNDKKRRDYYTVIDSIARCLIINGLEKLSVDEIKPEHLVIIDDYFSNEHKYASMKKYQKLYADIKLLKRIINHPRERNTVVTRMKKIRAFYNELVDRQEITISPFNLLGRKRLSEMMREEYDNPFPLRREELFKIMATEVPDELQEVKDVFLVQCALGSRIGEFQKFDLSKIYVSDDGIPYIHYLPPKTMKKNPRKVEVETPIMKFALEIMKRYPMPFTVLKSMGNKNDYNHKIRHLLEFCGIDRPVQQFNHELKENEYFPIYTLASSSICRSTNEEIMKKVQISMYTSGLHKVGSKAIEHYTRMELQDRFALMCVAFDQPQYKVDKDLNIIEEN